MIEARKISKTFGQITAVADLDLTISSGQVVGLIGPNGAGKSTTMQILAGRYQPDSGTLTIDGETYENKPLALRHKIGYLAEQTPFYQDMTVSEFLEFIARVRQVPELRANLEQLKSTCLLETVWSRPINQLSKGFRQRLGIAQAIVHRPSLLLLDEPTDGLDPNQKFQMRSLIQSFRSHCTVIISTHSLEEVTASCDWVIILAEGRKISDSSLPELLEQGPIEQVFRTKTVTEIYS